MRPHHTGQCCLTPDRPEGLTVDRLLSAVRKTNVPGHYILHEWRKEPDQPETIELRPSSPAAARLIYDALQRHGHNQLAAFINSLNRKCPEFWWAFETLAHVSLSDGGQFDLLDSLPENLPVLDLKQLDSFGAECEEYPFHFSASKAAKVFDRNPPKTAKQAQDKWRSIPPSEKETYFKKGYPANKLLVDFHRSAHAFVHANASTVKFSLDKMVTVAVNDEDDVQRAIREWSESDKNISRYFKPTDHLFGGIDSFAIFPEVESHYFNSRVVAFQIYAGLGTAKSVKNLSLFRNELVKACLLKSTDPLNLILVKPRGSLREYNTFQFVDDQDGIEDYVHQWTLALR